jgi:hypothetical protein
MDIIQKITGCDGGREQLDNIKQSIEELAATSLASSLQQVRSLLRTLQIIDNF